MEQESKIYENLNLIVAIGMQNEIGYQNSLIWRIKEDLQYFKETTMNSYLIMGRNTYESMPKNLKGRNYIVLSTNPSFTLEPPKIVTRSVSETLAIVSSLSDSIFFITGGSSIYNLFLPYVSTMHITEIEDTFKKADTYFPDYHQEDWQQDSIEKKTENSLNYKRLVLTRK